MIHLQFVTSSGLGSKAVRLFTWSEFSHVDFVLPNGKLLGARRNSGGLKGVAIRNPDYETFTKVAKYYVDVPIDVTFKIYNWALAQVGKPYDLTAIIGMVMRRDWTEPDSWYCSEYIAEAFRQAGHPLLVGKMNRITPRDLLLSPELIKE